MLDGIRVSWEWLCARPHPVSIPGSEITGLAERPIPLDELRTLLLDRGTEQPMRDAVWVYLIGRCRREGPTWTVACAGMALPMLATVYREATYRFAGDRADVCSAIVTGFVAALAEVDLTRPRVIGTLRWAAVRAGHAAVREALDAPTPQAHDRLLRTALTGATPPTAGVATAGADTGDGGVVDAAGSARPSEWGLVPRVSGHPDLVLAEAVAAGVITGAEAALIGQTRLERVPLTVVAAQCGRPVGAVTMQRLRAEMRLVDHLLAPDRDDPAGGTGVPGTVASRRRSSRTVTSDRTRLARPATGDGPAQGSRSVAGKRRRERTAVRHGERTTR